MSHCQLTPDYKSHLALEYRRKVTSGAPCPVTSQAWTSTCNPVLHRGRGGRCPEFEASLGYGSALPVTEPMSCKPAAHFWLLVEPDSTLLRTMAVFLSELAPDLDGWWLWAVLTIIGQLP